MINLFARDGTCLKLLMLLTEAFVDIKNGLAVERVASIVTFLSYVLKVKFFQGLNLC